MVTTSVMKYSMSLYKLKLKRKSYENKSLCKTEVRDNKRHV